VAHVRNTLALTLALTLFGVQVGAAQVPVPPTVPVATPVDTVASRRMRVDGGRLTPTQLVYETTLERDSGTAVLGYRSVTVSATTYAGLPAWLLLETRFGDGIPATDSLFTTFTGLTPMHWSAVQGSARLVTEFRSDTTFGGTSAPPGRRSIMAALPPGTIVSGAMLETMLRLLPLSITWEDSASVLSVSVSSNTTLPARLAVIGEDRVRVPAGTFDCWVVSVRADPARGMYWVTKQDPIVVRSAIDVPSMGTAQLVSALTRIGR
jgi:hypothetical protein